MRWFDRRLALLLSRQFGLSGAVRMRQAALVLFCGLALLQLTTTAMDAVTELAKEWLGDAWLASPLLLIGLFGLLAWRVPKASARLAPRVETETSPTPVRCLVLLLSPLGNPEDQKRRAAFLEAAELADNVVGELDSPAVRAAMDRHVWAMPLAGLRPHLPRIERLVVVCSADAPGGRGSIQDYPRFREMLARLWPAGVGRVQAAHEVPGLNLLATLPGGRRLAVASGVDPEDLQAQVTLLHALLERLRDLHGGEEEVLVDVTGQRKLATAAAVAVAVLVRRRRFQYVNEAKQARVFDITVDLSDLG